MDYLVSCNHLVKIVKVYMLPFCGEIKMNNIIRFEMNLCSLGRLTSNYVITPTLCKSSFTDADTNNFDYLSIWLAYSLVQGNRRSACRRIRLPLRFVDWYSLGF